MHELIKGKYDGDDMIKKRDYELVIAMVRCKATSSTVLMDEDGR